MIAPGRVACATLAAGLARRFGGDKLAAPYGGATVLDAALAATDGFAWRARCAIVAADRAAAWTRSDVSAIVNPAPARGMGGSLALAARFALDHDAAAVLVMLGDMPCVTADAVARLLALCPDDPQARAAMRAPAVPPGPPAIFGRAHLPRLAAQAGRAPDRGARAQLRDAADPPVLLTVPAAMLADVDTADDLARLAGGLGGGDA